MNPKVMLSKALMQKMGKKSKGMVSPCLKWGLSAKIHAYLFQSILVPWNKWSNHDVAQEGGTNSSRKIKRKTIQKDMHIY